jgi:hypothetical protein
LAIAVLFHFGLLGLVGQNYQKSHDFKIINAGNFAFHGVDSPVDDLFERRPRQFSPQYRVNWPRNPVTVCKNERTRIAQQCGGQFHWNHFLGYIHESFLAATVIHVRNKVFGER